MYTESRDITFEYEYSDVDFDGNGKAHKVTRTGHKTITVNVNMHDEAFNESVSESVGEINELTGAIVGFKTANVAVKKFNEKAIVGHVTSGFMNMIEQNLNIQNAGMEADMHALAGELTQQCKELEHKHEVMSKDFNRIKSRYTGLFEAINKEFRNRMQALIKPCFDFVNQVKNEQNRRIGSNLLSMATIGGKESDSARIALQASKMKQHAASLINSSCRYIDENRSLNRTIAVFSEGGNQQETYYAPIVIMSEQSDKTNDGQMKVFVNPMCNVGPQMEEYVVGRCSGLGDRQMSSDMISRISTYFNKQLDDLNDGTAEARRIVGQMRKLFENSDMKTLI